MKENGCYMQTEVVSKLGTCESAVCVRIESRIESFQLQRILILLTSVVTNEAKEMYGTTYSSLQFSNTLNYRRMITRS